MGPAFLRAPFWASSISLQEPPPHSKMADAGRASVRRLLRSLVTPLAHPAPTGCESSVFLPIVCFSTELSALRSSSISVCFCNGGNLILVVAASSPLPHFLYLYCIHPQPNIPHPNPHILLYFSTQPFCVYYTLLHRYAVLILYIQSAPCVCVCVCPVCCTQLIYLYGFETFSSSHLPTFLQDCMLK